MINVDIETTPTPVSAPVTSSPCRRVEDLDRELKYVLPLSRAVLACRWLDAVCRRDSQFPEADVWTVYFDTADQSSLEEKLNSDYLKTKVRVRWYAAPGQTGEGPVFVEAKFRVGSRRDKVRLPLGIPAGVLAGLDFHDPVFQEARRLLATVGLILNPRWQPTLLLRYRRVRLTESFSGTRVNLDGNITVLRVNHRHLFPSHRRPLPVAVVEVKGQSDDLPVRLRSLLRLGARKQAFSKYAAAYPHVQKIDA
jgi:hypothetical protein